MAPHSLYRLMVMCVVFLAVSFSLFFFLNELPRRSEFHSSTNTQRSIINFSSPPIERIDRGVRSEETSVTIDMTEPKDGSLTDIMVEDSQGVDHDTFPLILDAPDKKADGDGAAQNNVLKNELDEEQLREQIVKEDPTWVSWQKMNQVRYLSLLTGASIASSVICHPLHVIMMRQQVGAMSSRGGLLGLFYSVQEAIETLGLRGLFRGWVPLMLEAPSHALYFSTTESTREFLQTFLRKKFHFLGYEFTISTFFVDILQSLISAILANAISLIPWVPAEILSAKLAIQDRNGAVGMNEMISQIYQKDGFFGFFKGFFSSLTVHVTYSFLWWVSYSTTRRQVDLLFPTMQTDSLLFYDAITGILAGLASGFFNHPMDTIKLRIQTVSDDFEASSPNYENCSESQSPGSGNGNFNKNKNNDNNGHSGERNNSHDDYSNNDNYNHHNENHDNNHEKNYNGSNSNNYDNNYEKNCLIDEDSEKKKNTKKKREYNLISMGMLMVKREGISALFSGIGAAMYSTIFSSAFFCIIYEMIKRQSTV